MHHATGLNKHLAAPSDHRSILAVWLALSLAQLHSLITHTLIGQNVDKAFKQLNPRCINMRSMRIVYVLILSLRWSACIRCLLRSNLAAWGFREMSIERGETDRFDCRWLEKERRKWRWCWWWWWGGFWSYFPSAERVPNCCLFVCCCTATNPSTRVRHLLKLN